MDTLIENNCKFLIFAHHYEVLDAIEDYVIRNKIDYIWIDGKVDANKWHAAV